MPVRVAVLGGGAAGLMAAIRAAENGADVTVLERNGKPGVKILASGGGRCNLTTTRDGARLLKAFPEAQRTFLKPAFKALSPRRLRDWFEARGVALREEAMEKVFPVAGRASVILDALLAAANDVGVRIRLGERVSSVDATDGRFAVASTSGIGTYERVVLAVGGRSYPKAGTVGDGYEIAQRLGLSLTRRVPGLVGLLADAEVARDLAGVTVEHASIRLMDEESGRVVSRWDRPLLFTHQGLSGPGAMNLAGAIALRGRGIIRIDFMPEQSFEALDAAVLGASKTRTRTVTALLPRTLPERLRRAIVESAGVDPSTTAARLTREERRRIVHAVKDYEVKITGTLGWDRAEVTVGGVALEEVDRKTMEAVRVPGFHVCGEVLDVDGPIGGYNFQAAFATGWLAGEAVARGGAVT